ncbi:MAG: hypothetical protein WCA21_18220 [Terracidiphilus sp.]
MRRFLTLTCLLCLAIPTGISISGCTRNPGANYCNGLGYGTKISDITSITLSPVTSGISLAYGQTKQMSNPLAYTCKNDIATAPSSYTYGTTNNQLVDISPSGNICAGTWNRNTGGGIANYTICSPPSVVPTTGGLPYATAYVTASAQSVVSNPVEIFVHAQVTSITLVTQSTLPSLNAQQCFSQGQSTVLDGQACFAGPNNVQQVLCAPASVVASGNYACSGGVPAGVTSIPNCTAALGTFNYSVGNSSIANLATNTTTNQVTITAGQPGTTPITASVAGSGSSAGFFSTCPPESITLTLEDGSTSGIINPGTTQNLKTTVLDTQGKPITGMELDYQSTDPIDITAGASGAISVTLPGQASVYAICQPSSCNFAPVYDLGLFGTGLPLSSNPVNITTKGAASNYLWFSAPGQSQYMIPVELFAGTTGTVGSTIRLPYVPNSMMMDEAGDTIYLGSARELMVFSTLSSSVSKVDPAVPGVVLAVAPDNQLMLINDQQLHRFYLYNPTSGVSSTFAGMGSAAAWTPDSKTLYITDSAALNNAAAGITGHTDTLYVYNQNTGWVTQDLSASTSTGGSTSLAVTIPSVGAYLSGSAGFNTVAHTWCPTGTVGNYSSLNLYPQSDSLAEQTDVLAATTDGEHILGAALAGGGITLSDIGVTIPTTTCAEKTTGTAPNQVETLTAPLATNPALIASISIPNSQVNATAVNQVVTSPASNLAFITYTGSTAGAQLPYYEPKPYTQSAGGTQGALNYLPLVGGSAITAPLAGAFSPDDQYFFVSTAGDNKIHYISVPLVSSDPAHADTEQISPNLPACTPISAGGLDLGCQFSGPGSVTVVPATAIAVKPRATT